MKPTEPQTTFMGPVVRSQGRCGARAALQPLVSPVFSRAQSGRGVCRYADASRRQEVILLVPDTHLDLRAEMQWCGQWVTSSLKDTGLGRRRGELRCHHTAEILTMLSLTEWASAGLELWLFAGGGGGGLTFYHAHVWSCLNARQQPNDKTPSTAPYIMVWVRY